jgi:ABC-2 type transport system permease protein
VSGRTSPPQGPALGAARARAPGLHPPLPRGEGSFGHRAPGGREVRPLSSWRELAVIWMFVTREYRLQTYFKLAYLMGLMAPITHLVMYGMIARFGQEVPEIRALSGSYVDYVISGLVLNALLATALAGPYNGLMESFWSNRLEIIMSSPLRLPVFVTGISAGRYVDTLIRCAVYLAGGAIFLGFTWPAAPGLGPFLAVLAPALVACTGIGLAAAITIYTLDARGGNDPIRFVVETVSGLVAGVYFPLQVLPGWAQGLAHLVPHTYAIDGMRRALFGGDTLPPLPIHAWLPLPPLLADVALLTLYALVALPLGWRLFKFGMGLARSDGRLSRWL